jgi:hypothetical protein
MPAIVAAASGAGQLNYLMRVLEEFADHARRLPSESLNVLLKRPRPQ